jgi:hypothetical protein
MSENAIFICPYVSMNCGYYLRTSSRVLSGNTYNFICEQKPNMEIFIAPFAERHYFSKEFVSYPEYKEKLVLYRKYIKSQQQQQQHNAIKKSSTSSDLGLLKLMEIFGEHVELA